MPEPTPAAAEDDSHARAAVHNKFGTLFQAKGQFPQAVKQYRRAVALDPNYSNCHYNLGTCLASTADHAGAVEHFEAALAGKPDFAEAHANIAAPLLTLGRVEEAAAHCAAALGIDPSLPEAHFNLNTALRRLGRQSEAIAHSWGRIAELGGPAGPAASASATAQEELGGTAVTADSIADSIADATATASTAAAAPVPPTVPAGSSDADIKSSASSSASNGSISSSSSSISSSSSSSSSNVPLFVVCVKWGTKYGPAYVNKLFHGVRRHLRREEANPFTFVCFTDDSAGLEESIVVRALSGKLRGWWNKAELFAPAGEQGGVLPAGTGRGMEGEGGGTGGGGAAESDDAMPPPLSRTVLLPGRVMYFDLDSVVTGPLDVLAAYRGPFATLATDGMENERRVGGYNSSVMLWDGRDILGGSAGYIHSQLLPHFNLISRRVIYKFDHWLEMVVSGADVLQQLMPGVVVEYKQSCVDGVAEGASFVTFPLQPKPHNCESEWVKRLWTLDAECAQEGCGIEEGAGAAT